MIFARCKSASVELADALRIVALERLDDLGWKDVGAILDALESGPPPSDAGSVADDTDIPF